MNCWIFESCNIIDTSMPLQLSGLLHFDISFLGLLILRNSELLYCLEGILYDWHKDAFASEQALNFWYYIRDISFFWLFILRIFELLKFLEGVWYDCYWDAFSSDQALHFWYYILDISFFWFFILRIFELLKFLEGVWYDWH